MVNIYQISLLLGFICRGVVGGATNVSIAEKSAYSINSQENYNSSTSVEESLSFKNSSSSSHGTASAADPSLLKQNQSFIASQELIIHRNTSDVNFSEDNRNLTEDEDQQLQTNKLFKKSLALSHSLHNLNNANFNSWRPVYPSDDSNSFTSNNNNFVNKIPVIESSLKIVPESNPLKSVTKQPVTQYYFDLPTVIPTRQLGPLFDPSYILENHHLGILPTSIVKISSTSRRLSDILANATSRLTTVTRFDHSSKNDDVSSVSPEATVTLESTPIFREHNFTKTLQTLVPQLETVTKLSNVKTVHHDIPSSITFSSVLATVSIDSTLSPPSEVSSVPLKNKTNVIRETVYSTDSKKEFTSPPKSLLPLSDLFHNSSLSKSIGTYIRPPSETNITSTETTLNETETSNYLDDFTVVSTIPHDLTDKFTTESNVEIPTTFHETTEYSTQEDTTSVTLEPEVLKSSQTESLANVTHSPTRWDPSSSTTSVTSTVEVRTEDTTTYVEVRNLDDALEGEEKKDNNGGVVYFVSNKTENEEVLDEARRLGEASNTTGPFIKGAVAYNLHDFCRNRQNLKRLLNQWINAHLSNDSVGGKYDVEMFYEPDCGNLRNLYIDDGSSPEPINRTTFYFYVKRDDLVDSNSTLKFPKNLTDLEISQELHYLKERILDLELMNASSSDLLMEEAAAVRTSIVVIAVVISLLLLVVITVVLVFFAIKRRRASDSVNGRRCTPAVNDAYSMDSVSVFYQSFRRKSRKRASNKSLRSYLNQGFDDPNGPSHPLNFQKITRFISDNEAIHHEFTAIPSAVPKYDELPRGVEEKNRYANVIPVPETRICLGGGKLTPSAEYINANTIHGPKGELRYYIATQAPMENTVSDFWQMVWEQESKIIVMLTDFVEKGVEKCADYLPPSETLDCHRVYGDFQITLKSRDMRDNYIVSMLQIKNLDNNLVREVAHMWYNRWPQSGVPREEKSFVSFILDVRMTRKQLRAKGPIIVHCSPGTGRTGTYIASDLVMRQFDDQRVVDVPKTVFRIRRERSGAVQTKDQYAFIYRVVNWYMAKISTGNLDSF